MWVKISEERGKAFQKAGAITAKAVWQDPARYTGVAERRPLWPLCREQNGKSRCELIGRGPWGQIWQKTVDHTEKLTGSLYFESNSKPLNTIKRGSSMINIPVEIKYFWGGLEKRADRRVPSSPPNHYSSFEVGCNHLTDADRNLCLAPSVSKMKT